MNPSFVPPINLYIQLPILIVVISLVYSATRYDDWGSICHEAIRWGSRMALFLISIGLVLYLISIWI